jgi:hypothetical protein
LQAQENEPGVLEHAALGEQLCVPVEHSFTSVQVVPVPVNPGLQAHVKLPWVLAHAAFAEQLWVPAVHSLTSLHVTPFPE